jgi:hypothetical protein
MPVTTKRAKLQLIDGRVFTCGWQAPVSTSNS